MRLIDVEPLEGLIKQHLETTDSALFFSALSTFARLLEMTPTADAVPVVRCKDCRWWDKERKQCGITPSSSPYGHCHDGETLEHSQIKDAGR